MDNINFFFSLSLSNIIWFFPLVASFKSVLISSNKTLKNSETSNWFIPPNAEFTAVLGDQKNGRNLEAPEDLIRQIVREETEAIANRPIYVSAEVSGKTLMDIIAEQTTERSRANGNFVGGGSLVY